MLWQLSSLTGGFPLIELLFQDKLDQLLHPRWPGIQAHLCPTCQSSSGYKKQTNIQIKNSVMDTMFSCIWCISNLQAKFPERTLPKRSMKNNWIQKAKQQILPNYSTSKRNTENALYKVGLWKLLFSLIRRLVGLDFRVPYTEWITWLNSSQTSLKPMFSIKKRNFCAWRCAEMMSANANNNVISF